MEDIDTFEINIGDLHLTDIHSIGEIIALMDTLASKQIELALDNFREAKDEEEKKNVKKRLNDWVSLHKEIAYAKKIGASTLEELQSIINVTFIDESKLN